MAKKFSLMLAAVAVLAFAIPSIASATEATLPAGTRAPLGTQIVETGNDVILQSTLLGKITCSTLNLNGEITKNDGTTVEGSGENFAPTQSGCVFGEKAVIITHISTKLFSNEKGKGIFSFTTLVNIGSEIKCTFTGTNVPFTFTSGTDTISFSSAGGISGIPPACGTLKLTASFTLESTTGVALILD
jgi:hypothetical protein